MNQLKYIFWTILLAALYSCQSYAPPQVENHSENYIDEFMDQSELLKLVISSEIVDAGRSLVHVSHACNLIINHEQYMVVDMRELTKGAVVPRGLNQIIVLNRALQLVQRIEYVNARPLFCEGNKLYLHGRLIVDGQSDEGNVLIFDDFGFKVRAQEENLNGKLPLW